MFDMLYEIHISIGHRGRDRIIKQLNRRYKNIIQNDIKLFFSVYEPCELNEKWQKEKLWLNTWCFTI